MEDNCPAGVKDCPLVLELEQNQCCPLDNKYFCAKQKEYIKALEQQLEEANDLLKRCEHKLVYYLSGEPAHELAEAIKEHLK